MRFFGLLPVDRTCAPHASDTRRFQPNVSSGIGRHQVVRNALIVGIAALMEGHDGMTWSYLGHICLGWFRAAGFTEKTVGKWAAQLLDKRKIKKAFPDVARTSVAAKVTALSTNKPDSSALAYLPLPRFVDVSDTAERGVTHALFASTKESAVATMSRFNSVTMPKVWHHDIYVAYPPQHVRVLLRQGVAVKAPMVETIDELVQETKNGYKATEAYRHWGARCVAPLGAPLFAPGHH